ncbi:hypothetical protein JD844_024995 [Phrynosoma platyrhinos]|uniref:Protein FAM98A n=1 Tax=Phrynosoma platyrhinos TaxID=52577 RepID=A0ABQ7SZ52_PHRPL|nr:hypothetical protein JD844_024995 [Phrynosoma platyrhinos]
MEFELMENDILESLEDLGYKGPLLEDGALTQAASGGASSPEYTKLCAWLVSELRLFCKLEENVQATNSPSEADEFQLEMSGLLSEMNCPYTTLTSGDVTKRLLNQRNCLLVLTYLISELEAARMLCVNAPPKKAQEGSGSEVFQELKGICIALGMSKPPSNITMFQFFSGIEKKEKIEGINQAIANEYEVRRKLLVKRLDVTVQSFGWSDRAKVVDPMKLSHRLLRCHHGKKDKMALSSKAEVEEVDMSHHMEAVAVMSKVVMTEEVEEDMIKEAMTEEAVGDMTHHTEVEAAMNMGAMNEEGEDVVVMTMEAEGEEEEANKEAGLMVEEVAIKMSTIGIVTIEIRAFKLAVTMVVAALATKEVEAMVVTSLLIQEVDIKVVVEATSKTTDTKMGTLVIEVEVVEEGEVAVEVVVAVAGKEVAGEEEVHKTLIKGGSLSSTSNMEVISTISLDLDKEDTSQAEATKLSILIELM